MAELTPLVLDLILDPEQIAREATSWLYRQPGVYADVQTQQLLHIVAMKAAQLAQAEVREIAASLDQAREAEPGR